MPLVLGLDLFPINWQWGNVGEVAGAAATFGALVFAWVQIRAERERTQQAIDLARQTLEFERERAADDSEARARAMVTGIDVLIAISERLNHPKDYANLQVTNHTGVVCYQVTPHIVGPSREVYTSPERLMRLPPGKDRLWGMGEFDGGMLTTDSPACVTFRDADGNWWSQWTTGELRRWDGDIESLRNR